MLTDAQWLGLLLVTESNLPHEWPFVGWTVRRRVESNRPMFGGATYAGVILKKDQFSAFRGFSGTESDIYENVRNYTDAKGRRIYPDAQIDLAEHCAAWVLGTAGKYAPISDRSFYYFSPVSMVPAGSLPKWDWSKLRRYGWPNVDPYRFTACEEIA